MAFRRFFLARLAAGLAGCLALVPAANAADHACAADALTRAKKLIRFHAPEADGGTIGDGTSAKVLAPVRALKGSGTLDVLEVTSSIYKADYRMRFIYVRTKDKSCALMGQEILEASNPY